MNKLKSYLPLKTGENWCICFDSSEIMIKTNACNHICCELRIDRWLLKHYKCPLCRTELFLTLCYVMKQNLFYKREFVLKDISVGTEVGKTCENKVSHPYTLSHCCSVLSYPLCHVTPKVNADRIWWRIRFYGWSV